MKKYVIPEIEVMKIATESILLVSGGADMQPKITVGGLTAQSIDAIDANVFDN